MGPDAVSGAEPAALSRRRRTLVWTLVVLASVIALASILTTWVNRQMLDDQSWEDASTELIQDEEIRNALSVYLVNELWDNVDVAQALQQRLPPELEGLAGPLAGALRQPATNAFDVLLARPRVQQLWINASALAHEKLVNVLEDDTGFGISTGEGVVTLDLSELVQELGVELGLSEEALAKLPPDAGVVTLMRSDQLEAAQQGIRVVKVLSVWLLVLVFALYGLAIYLARGARRATLRNVGWALILVGLATLVTRRVVGDWAIEALTQPQSEPAGDRVWLIGSEILGEIGVAAVIYGAIAVIGATLAGPTAAAIGVRRRLAPVMSERPGLVWSGAAAVYLLLVAWGPTHALRTWWGILLLGLLGAVGIVALQRQMRRELAEEAARPVRPAPPPSDTAPVPAAVAGPAPESSLSGELARLAALRDAGVISGDEFERAKSVALSRA